MKKHTEARLEDAIVDSLTQQGGFVFVDYRAGAGFYSSHPAQGIAKPACHPQG
jgi:hypothetical protein